MLSLPRRRRAFAIAIFVLVVIVTAAPGYEAIAQRMDDGALLLYPELILKGWLPYRDFETFYGPANIYFLAGVYSLFHPGMFVARSVGLFYQLAILAAIFCIVRPRGLILALGSTFIAHLFLLATGLSPRSWTGGLACALWALFLLAENFESRRTFFSGAFLAAIALLFRPDLAPALALSVGLLLFFQIRAWRIFLTGFCVGLLPMLWLAWCAGFRNIFDNLFLYPVVVTNPARRLPWSSLSPQLTLLLGLMLMAAVINLGTGFLALRKDRGSWPNRLFAATAIFALGSSHQALQRMDTGHVALCCFLAMALFPVSLAIVVDRWRSIPVQLGGQLLIVALTLLLITGIAPGLIQIVGRSIGIGARSRHDDVVMLEHRGRDFPMSSVGAAREIGDVLAKVVKVASPGQRLFVGPADLRRTNYNDTFLYHLLPELTPATYFLEMNPLSANRLGSRLSADILSADWLILDHQLDDWNEPNESSHFGPEAPNQVVETNFKLRARYGAYEVYRRK